MLPFRVIADVAANLFSLASQVLHREHIQDPEHMLPFSFLLVLSALFVLPLELSQLICAVIGAGAYTIWHGTQRRSSLISRRPKKFEDTVVGRGVARKQTVSSCNTSAQRRSVLTSPILDGKSWESDTQVLLSKIMHTASSELSASNIAAAIKEALVPIIPEADVSAFVFSELGAGASAFRVAVPDLEVVVHVSHSVLAQRLQRRVGRNRDLVRHLDGRQLEKAAIRLIADNLVSVHSFKFRRSALRGEEPKLTLLAPAFLSETADAIPLDLSVNATTPLYHSALLLECDGIDHRIKELVLLVRRWAKDRGICHAAKGHLSPYLWTLLVVYFLQVGVQGEDGIVPPLSTLRSSSKFVSQGKDTIWTRQLFSLEKVRLTNLASTMASISGRKLCTGKLFKQFLNFYADFDWSNEVINPLSGCRASPELSLQSRAFETTLGVAPIIVNPLHNPEQTRGHCCTVEGFQRLNEELHRGKLLSSRDANLAQMLEPWAPLDSLPEFELPGEL